MTYQELFVELGEAERVAIRTYPVNGEPIVFVHGAGLNLALWESVANLLVDSYHVVCVDLRGHGASTGSPSFSFAADVAAIEAVIADLELLNPAIVGHSYGGMIALEYARTHPECPFVVNVDGRGGQGRPDHYLNKVAEVDAYWTPFEEEMIASLATIDAGPRAWVEAEVSEHRGEYDGPTFDRASQMIERMYQPADGDTWMRSPSTPFLTGLLEHVWHRDIFDSYQHAQCPVAFVLAAKEPTGPLEGQPTFRTDHLEALARVFPTLGSALPRRRVFPVDAGHMIPVEDPDRLAAIIFELLPAATT